VNPAADWRRADRLDWGDRGIADAVDCNDAGTDCGAINMNDGGAAQRHTATKLRAGHAEHVAQYPEQWRRHRRYGSCRWH
jgi:hypothetical protein